MWYIPRTMHITHIFQDYFTGTWAIIQYNCPHDDVIKWKHFPRNWPFVRGIHRSPVNSPHKGQWRGALMFTLICARIYGWVNTREAGDLRRYRLHYDVIVMPTELAVTGNKKHINSQGVVVQPKQDEKVLPMDDIQLFRKIKLRLNQY